MLEWDALELRSLGFGRGFAKIELGSIGACITWMGLR